MSNIPVKFDDLWIGTDLYPKVATSRGDILAAITIVIQTKYPGVRSDRVVWGGEGVTWGGDADVRWD